ncbi:FliA/WhiG family RNA polymerase sigma factor [bacterium]|nr:FliA/WhiG family RNA polymerase sigma factor [bacterium]
MTPPALAKLSNDEIWQLWVRERSQEIKDELVLRYLTVVEQTAGRMKIGLPRSVQVEELTNAGIIGLISAVENFEPERGFRFETYAGNRIRGAILDTLRDYDWMPRSIRSKTRQLENALVKLEGSLGEVPSDEQVAQELGLSLEDYYSMLDEVKVASILSLDQPLPGPEGEMSSLSEMISDEDSEDPHDVINWNEAKAVAKKMIQGLKQQERLVIALYYYEELTLREVGEVLDISESRVSQIHSKVMLTLKGKLRAKLGAGG